MTLDSLETAMFGYKKSSVFRYITETEQAFSARLLAQEQSAQKKEAQLQARIQQLEEECDALRRQLAAQQDSSAKLSELLADAEQLAEKVQTESLSREQAIRRMLDEEQAMRQQVLEQYLAQLRDVCALQSGADTAMTATEQENGMEDPMQEPETSEQKTETPCTVLETAEHEPETSCAASQVPAVEQEETVEEPNEDETAVPTQDGARSVRVGGTAEVYQADVERNMSLFQRRVYPAD